MANWIQIPNGPVVNADNIKTMEVRNNVLILEMVSQRQMSAAYGTSSAAYAAQASIESSVLNPTSGSPILGAISPASVAFADAADLIITGTNFRSTATINIGGTGIVSRIFVSTNCLALHWAAGTLPAGGPYNVVYADSSGGADTLVGAFTVT